VNFRLPSWFFLDLVLPLLIGVGVFVCITFPSITTFSTALIGNGADSFQHAGFQQLVADNLSHGRWPFAHTTRWRFPAGFEFGRGYDGVLPNLLGGALILVTGQPVLSYNLVILSGCLFNFLSAFALFRYASRSRSLGLLGALMWGFSFYAIARSTGHTNLMLVGGFALCALAWLRYLQERTPRKLAWVAAAYVLIALCSVQYLVMSVIVTMFFLISLLLFARPAFFQLLRAPNSHWAAIAASGAITTIILLPFLWPFVQATLRKDFVDVHADGKGYTAALVDFLIPNSYVPTTQSQVHVDGSARQSIEYVVAFGALEVVLVLWALYRLRRWPWLIALSAPILVLSVFALGKQSPDFGITLPYAWIAPLFPFSTIPEPGRFVVVTQLFTTGLIVTALSKLTPERRWVASVLFLAVLLERLPLGGFIAITPSVGDYTRIVRAQSGKGVLDLPFYESSTHILGFYYQKSLVDGFAHYLSSTPESLAFIKQLGLERFSCEAKLFTDPDVVLPPTELLAQLKAADVRTIVLHKDGRYNWSICDQVLAVTTALLPQVKTASDHTENTAPDHYYWSGTDLNSGLQFPKRGSLSFSGFTLLPAPSELSQVTVRFQNQDIDLSTWQRQLTTLPNGVRLARFFVPTATPSGLPTRVNAGDVLQLISPETAQNRGEVQWWYTYTSEVTSPVIHYSTPLLERVYSSAQADVYQIR
jgi:hypothetical protein